MARFTFVDNSAEVLRRMVSATDRSARQLENDLVEAVQEKILYGYSDPHGPDGHTEIVDTGRLFDSIKGEVKRVSQNTVDVNVGATGDTPYAIFVHQGTRKLKGRPFIRDGVEGSRAHIREVMQNNYENA